MVTAVAPALVPSLPSQVVAYAPESSMSSTNQVPGTMRPLVTPSCVWQSSKPYGPSSMLSAA